MLHLIPLVFRAFTHFQVKARVFEYLLLTIVIKAG